jgi:hypothetical protein
MSELTRHGLQAGWIKAASLQAWLHARPRACPALLPLAKVSKPCLPIPSAASWHSAFPSKDHASRLGSTALLDEFSRAVLSGWADRLQTGPLPAMEWEKLLLANFNTVLALDGKDPKGKTKGKSGIGLQPETTPAISEGQLQKEGLVQEKSQVGGLEAESGSETTLDEDDKE